MCASTQWAVAKNKTTLLEEFTIEPRKYFLTHLQPLGSTLAASESKVNEIFH